MYSKQGVLRKTTDSKNLFFIIVQLDKFREIKFRGPWIIVLAKMVNRKEIPRLEKKTKPKSSTQGEKR